MYKEMFEQWTNFGKNSFKPPVDLNPLLQEINKINKNYFTKISSPALELMTAFQKCTKIEDAVTFGNKFVHDGPTNCMAFVQNTLDAAQEGTSICREWFDNQVATFSEQQAKTCKSTKTA